MIGLNITFYEMELLQHIKTKKDIMEKPNYLKKVEWVFLKYSLYEVILFQMEMGYNVLLLCDKNYFGKWSSKNVKILVNSGEHISKTIRGDEQLIRLDWELI